MRVRIALFLGCLVVGAMATDLTVEPTRNVSVLLRISFKIPLCTRLFCLLIILYTLNYTNASLISFVFPISIACSSFNNRAPLLPY